MRRILLAGLMTAAVALVATAAFAQGPSFQTGTTGGVMQGSTLLINFQEFGLTSGASTNLIVTGTAQVNEVCLNRAGKVPAAANMKFNDTAPLQSEVFNGTADNGTLSGTITLTPTSAIGCPTGLNTVVLSVTYTNVQIVDQTNNVVFSIPGTFEYTNPESVNYLGKH